MFALRCFYVTGGRGVSHRDPASGTIGVNRPIVIAFVNKIRCLNVHCLYLRPDLLPRDLMQAKSQRIVRAFAFHACKYLITLA